jgi:adenylate cyclase class IV
MNAFTKLLLLILFLTSCSFLRYKNKSSIFIETDERILGENSKCVYKPLLTIEERKKLYPFKQASKVLLISFNDQTQPQDKTPTKGNRIDSTNLRQVTKLEIKEIDSLSSLLYNVGVNDKSKNTIIEQASCYNPKHSIIFLDNNDQIIDYIEICFACSRYVTKTEKIREIEMCSSKYEIIKEYFKRFGFKFE